MCKMANVGRKGKTHLRMYLDHVIRYLSLANLWALCWHWNWLPNTQKLKESCFSPRRSRSNLWLAKIFSWFSPYREKPSAKKDDGLPWKGYNVNPFKAAFEMYKLQQHCRKILLKITQPTLVFTGGKDQTIAPDFASIILDGIKSNKKCLIHMAHSSHVILIDHELDQVTKIVLAFINQNLSGRE